jgi:hypothetical protein
MRLVIQPGSEDGNPEIGTRGVVQIQDGTSNTVLIAERTGSTASCSADPGTGTQVLDSMSLLFRDPRSGDIVEFLVQPVDAPAPVPGTFEVVMRSGDDVWMGEITVRQPVPPDREHDRR